MKEELSQIYANHHRERGRYNYLFCQGSRVPWIQKWIGKGKRVLDLGCRDGTLTQEFAKGNEVIGVDIDQHALQLVQKRLGIETHWLDLNAEWPFPKGSFDVVICCELLEHLFFPQVTLQKIALLLKEGGSFIGSVPNAFRMRNRWKFLWGKEFDSDPTHLHIFSYQKLMKLLHHQFASVEMIPLQGKILPFIPVSQRLPNRLNRLFAKDFLWHAKVR
ncbi:MAG: class I SAM-dependent methyltransferase [Chlamydiia bacterium]|nr:class I SAM-dependent methyltransferase [Chlamydiia bacterium]